MTKLRDRLHTIAFWTTVLTLVVYETVRDRFRVEEDYCEDDDE